MSIKMTPWDMSNTYIGENALRGGPFCIDCGNPVRFVMGTTDGEIPSVCVCDTCGVSPAHIPKERCQCSVGMCGLEFPAKCKTCMDTPIPVYSIDRDINLCPDTKKTYKDACNMSPGYSSASVYSDETIALELKMCTSDKSCPHRKRMVVNFEQ